MSIITSRNFTYVLFVVLLLQVTGCCRKQAVEIPGARHTQTPQNGSAHAKKPELGAEAVKPLQLLENTGLNYSIDSRSIALKKSTESKSGSFFEKQYIEGVEMMEKGEFSKAISVFDELIKRYPNSEEASIAELCIAELHFRSKANELALKAYEQIVERYPNSHAAENARSGIDYLRNIERYETEFIAPDVEARKRRGY